MIGYKPETKCDFICIMWPQNFSKGMCTKIYGEVADKDKDKNKEASPSSQLQDKGGKDTGALHAPYPLLDFYHSIQTKRAQARKRLEISRVYQRTLSLSSLLPSKKMLKCVCKVIFVSAFYRTSFHHTFQLKFIIDHRNSRPVLVHCRKKASPCSFYPVRADSILSL